MYHLSHSDVLITELPSRKNEAQPTNDILASSRTISALKQSQSKHGVDPWHAGDDASFADPWASYTPNLKAPRIQPGQPSQSQVAALGINLEKQITAQVLQQVEQKLAGEDTNMGGAVDHKIQTLETKIQQVEKSLHEHTVQQTKMNQQTSSQLSSLQQQVDQQSKVFQQHLDSRMQDQMNQIERLLTQNLNREGEHKKPRQE